MGGGSLGPGDVGLPVPRVWGRDLGRRPMVPALRVISPMLHNAMDFAQP